MALLKKHNFNGPEMIVQVIIDQSDTIQMGDAVNLRNGNVEIGTADSALAGVVVGLVDANGNSVFSSLAVLGSATVSGSEFSGSVAVASDNETVDRIAAEIDVSPYTVYSATVTGTMGTTSSSEKIGGWIDMDDENSVEETTFTRTITTGGQLSNWGEDPDDTTRMLVSIHEHEFFNTSVTQA